MLCFAVRGRAYNEPAGVPSCCRTLSRCFLTGPWFPYFLFNGAQNRDAHACVVGWSFSEPTGSKFSQAIHLINEVWL